MIFVMVGVAFLTLLERRVLGYVHIRKGPNKVGFVTTRFYLDIFARNCDCQVCHTIEKSLLIKILLSVFYNFVKIGKRLPQNVPCGTVVE